MDSMETVPPKWGILEEAAGLATCRIQLAVCRKYKKNDDMGIAPPKRGMHETAAGKMSFRVSR